MQWLGRQITRDPRFASATVLFWWQALMGSHPLEAPADPRDFGFAENQAAYNAQQSTIADLARGFESGFGSNGSPYNLKDLLVEMAMTPWFRADSTAVTLDAKDELRLEAAGLPRLLTPLQLERKTRALTGIVWNEFESYYSPYLTNTQLSNNRLNYGGIDSDGVTERNYELTSVMSQVAFANALGVACTAVALDFSKPSRDRLMFAGIETRETPAGSNSALRLKLADLHWHMLGQQVSPNSAEVDRSYELLESVWRARDAEARRTGDTWLDTGSSSCDNGGPLEEANVPYEQWADDPTLMKAAWRAVLVYFMTHYHFLHE